MPRHRWMQAGLVIMLSIAAAVAVRSQPGGVAQEWRYFGGDKAFTRYSPLDQIDRNTVKNLRIAWRRPAVNDALTKSFPTLRSNAYLRATPILVDGVLYTQDANGMVTAIDPETGRTIWVEPSSAATLDEANAGRSTRGVDVWRDPRTSAKRIIAIRGESLVAVNAETGMPADGFGNSGRVSLHFAGTQALVGRFGDSTGPLVVGNVIVVTGNTNGAGDGGNHKEAQPEDVRGYDAASGALLWTFHVVPQPGEVGHDSWQGDSWQVAGDLGAWNPMTADEALGYVYIPLTAPTAASYGGWRTGDNLFSNSLVALDARTGKRVWHYQMIHHDLWEYDNVGPATLGDITVDGRVIKAVMQPNKSGFLFVLDRVTGTPVWPIEERPVPQSTVPGEHTSPTQPFPTRPPAFDRQGLMEEDLIDYTPALKARAKEVVKDYQFGPLFAPPSLISNEPGGKKGTLKLPGGWGSANWNTGAFDPESSMYYAVSMLLPGPGVQAVVPQTDPGATMAYAGRGAQPPAPGTPPPPPEGGWNLGGLNVDGLPVFKGPYGRITALDLKTGTLAWMAANGDGPRYHPALKDLNLPPLGVPNRPAPLLTRTLLFLGEGSDAVIGTPRVDWGWGRKFRAYDKATGAVIWETELPSGTTSGPMTYMAGGKQFIVVAVGDNAHPPEYVALSLP